MLVVDKPIIRRLLILDLPQFDGAVDDRDRAVGELADLRLPLVLD